MKANHKSQLIFLCHAKEDREKVRNLYENLKQTGFKPWIDEIDILPGQNWDYEIKKILKSADFILICLSKQSVIKRGYLNKEIKWALDLRDEMLEGDIFIIPVKLEDCELPDRISDMQFVELFKENGFGKLVNALKYQKIPLNPSPFSRGQALEKEWDLKEISSLKDGETELPPFLKGGRGDFSTPNPFYYSDAVPSHLFYGRKEILQSIKNRIAGHSLQSVSIVGERRIGKSSLINYVKYELFKDQSYKYLIIYSDLMKAYCKTRKGLMQSLRRELTKSWHQPWQESEDGNLSAFDFALEDLQAENIRLVLCLDEVENLTKNPKEFDDMLEDWRACASMGQMAMITASAKPLADLCREHKLISPFFNIFSQEYLGLLQTEEWQALIKNNMPVNADDLHFIEQMAGGHPFFTQMTAYHLWEIKAKGKTDYDRLKAELNEQMRPHLEYLWNKLNDSEKSALRYCAGKSSVKPDKSVLNRMIWRGILRNGKPFSEVFEELIMSEPQIITD